MKVIIDNKEIRDNVFQMFLSIIKGNQFVEINMDELSDEEFDELKTLSICLFNGVCESKANRQTKLDIAKFEEENPHIASLVNAGIINYVLFHKERNGSRFLKDNYYYKTEKNIMIRFEEKYYIAHNFNNDAQATIPYKEHETIDDAILHIEKYLNDKEKI